MASGKIGAATEEIKSEVLKKAYYLMCTAKRMAETYDEKYGAFSKPQNLLLRC